MRRSGPPRRKTPMQRTQMKRGDPVKARDWQRRAKPIAPMSKQRAAENRVRRKALHAAFGDNPACWACPILRAAGIDTGCNGRADDGHELYRRGKGGSITDVTNVRPVGRPCHIWITEHPTRARELGLEIVTNQGPPRDRPAC